MKRNDFIRNTIMGLAASMLPKILQPVLPEIVEDIYDGAHINWWMLYDEFAKREQVSGRSFWWVEYGATRPR